LDTTSALVSEKKIKKGRVAPASYVPDKKWKVILRFDTSNTVQLDPEYRKYYQYKHACDSMEKSCMKMLQWYICISCFVINTNAGCLGRNILKDSYFEIRFNKPIVVPYMS
jgi:hypothetical protein